MAPASARPFPPPPVDTLDWNNAGFKVHEVNGHIEAHFSPSAGGWSEPKFVASPYIRIHGLSPSLNYGQQAFEGLKAFRHVSSNRITLFRPDRHAARFKHSAETVSIPPVPEDLFIQCVKLAVAVNAEYVPPANPSTSEGGTWALYIRPLLFSPSPHLALSPPQEYTFAVFVTPTSVYHGVKALDALILEDLDRAAPRGTGSAKVGGNYAPVMRHSERARAAQEGFGITLHLDSATRSEVEEFSTSAFIGVRKNATNPGAVTLVIPDSTNVLDSVTASSVCTIAEHILGYKIEKRRIPYSEIRDFDEVLAAGTAAALVPIRSITMKSRNDKFSFTVSEDEEGGGPVCAQLLQLLQGIQTGTVEDRFGWVVDVEAPPVGFTEGA